MAASTEQDAGCAAVGPAPTTAGIFVGRADELAELGRAVEALATGRGSLVLLSGEPGIGKTRLCEELARIAAAAGIRALWGRCHDAAGRPPYWPWAQVIQACVRDRGAAALTTSLLPDGLPLAELVPELRAHLPRTIGHERPVDPDTARFRLFQAVTAPLRALATERGLVVILDDLHWADLPSLRMLEFLAHDLPGTPILAVGTFREVDARRAPGVADVIDRLARHARRFPLAGFTVEEVLRFVEASAGERVSEGLAERLRCETEGNPFFLDELIRHFRGAGWWSPTSGPPLSHGVRSAIRQRLAPLPEATLQLLAAAAVAGREFDLSLLEAVVAIPRPVLLERLTPAVDIEIVSPVADRPGRYRFSHALTRETIYEQVPPNACVELHRRFGNVLEERHRLGLDAYLPELARHFFAAAAGGAEAKALDYVERAGRQALRLLAYEEAVDHLQRALHLNDITAPSDAVRECELLLALAEALHRAGQAGDSAKACHRAAAVARRLGSSALLARAAIALCDIGVGWAEFGRCDDTLVHLLEEALAQLDPSDAALRAPVMARIATELFWTRPLEEVDALSRDAVELARRSGDDRSLAYALMARIHCVSDPDSYDRRRQLIDEVIALSGGRGKLAINAYLWRFGDELQFGDPASARTSGEKLIRAVQDLRQPRDMWLVPAVRSRQALLHGDFAEAERLAEELLEHSAGVANAEQFYLALLFTIRREQGRHGELLEGLAAIASQSVVALWRAPLALLYAENGAPERATAELDMLTRDGMQGIRRDLTWLFSVASLAAACAAAGSTRHAAPLYDALRPYDGRNVAEGVFCYFGPVAYYLGILAARCERHTAAMRHLDDALTAAHAIGARPFIARILLAQAEALDARGGADASRAGALRGQALDLAESMGMHGVAVAARQRPAHAPDVSAPPRWRAGLHCEGDYWVVSYEGRTERLKAIKGFVYLARLLAAPGQEFHVLEMVARAAAERSPVRAEGFDSILDPRAQAEIRRRLVDLRDEHGEAEANNDPYRAAKALAEIEAIGEALAGTVGLGGRPRRSGSQAERARAAVTKALRTAIDRIERFDPGLADVLSRTVRTGVFCSYVPLAQVPIAWEVGGTARDRLPS